LLNSSGSLAILAVIRGFVTGECSVRDEVRVEHDARMLAAQRHQGALAGFDRYAPQVLTVELDQIECAKDRGRARAVHADKVEDSKPLLVGDDRLAVDEAGARRQRRDRRSGQREAPREIGCCPAAN
jgi:hypothetical protein